MYLSELIRQTMKRKALTFDELGRRAEAAGAPVQPNFHYLSRKKHLTRFPEVTTLHYLAAGLGIDLGQVVDAALQSVGLRVQSDPGNVTRSGSQTGDHVIHISAENRTPEQVAAMREAAESVVQALESEYDGGDTGE